MYKKITALLCLTLSIVLFGFTASATDAINTVYVSGTAAEGGTGVISAPVSSLAEAYSLIGSIRNGTIYLMDTVSVSATSGDCFIAPTHIGKITVSSADGYDGALDLSGVEHYHFGGETEWSNIGIIANELVLTADNHIVTMGDGLTMSSTSGNTVYRGGHTFCGARVHLAAYAPCDTASGACETAGGELNVYSGEYWTVSAWYGDAVTLTGGSTFIHLDTRNENDSIRLRYLCPGLYCAEWNGCLTADDVTVNIAVNDGLNVVEAYRFTHNSFAGSMTVNWLLHESAQGSATVFVAKDFYPAYDAECTLNVYADQSNATAKASASLLMRGVTVTYLGDNSGNTPISTFCTDGTHSIVAEKDGRLLCILCGYEQCRHRTKSVITTTGTPDCSSGYLTYSRCTDLCGEELEPYYDDNVDPGNHADYLQEYVGYPATGIAKCVCSGCGYEFSSINVMDMGNEIYISYNDNLEDIMHTAAACASIYGDISINILGNYVVTVPANYQTPKFDATISISGGILYFPDIPRRIYMNGDMTFEHVTFKTAGTYNGAHIYAQNHKLVMGEGIVMGNDSTIPTGEGYPDCNSVRMYIAGGFEGVTDNVMNTDITIRSGDYWFIGGFNRNASTNNGTSKITIGKTDADDYLSVNYLTPFSTGDGYITEESAGTIIVDGDVNVRWFYVTTMNKATTDVRYTTNIYLEGDVNPDLSGAYPIDLRGGLAPYPLTTVNIYYDNTSDLASDDYAAFVADSSLDKIDATVNVYPYDSSIEYVSEQ